MEHHVNLSAIGRDPIQVVLNDGGKRGSRSSKPLDPRAKYERMLKAFKKKLSISALKSHLVCWLAHGFYLNRLCLDNDELNALMLSYSDTIVASVELNNGFNVNTLRTYLNNFNSVFVKDDEKDLLLKASSQTITVESIKNAIENTRLTSYLEYILMLIISLRIIGVKTRLCLCFDVLQIGSEYKSLDFGIKNHFKKILNS